MNVHSVEGPCPPPHPRNRRAVPHASVAAPPRPRGRPPARPVAPPPPAATSARPSSAPPSQVFAERGFFNAQVADVARAAGVAAGTVYLYFRSKDDLLVSIFEKTMREAIDDGRAALAGLDRPRRRASAASPACTSSAWAATATSPSCSRSSSARARSSWSSSPPRRSANTSASSATSSPTGRQQGLLRPGVNPTIAAKVLFGALDEMATNWILSRRRYRSRIRRRRRPRPLSSWSEGLMRSAAVLGAGTMGAQIAAHLANAGVPTFLLDLNEKVAREGFERARKLKPDPFFVADNAVAHHRRRLRHAPRAHQGLRVDHRGDRRTPGHQAERCSRRSSAPAARRGRQLEHLRHPDRRHGRGPERRLPPALPGHALLQSAALPAPARDHPDAGDGPRRDRAHRDLRRSPPRQGRGAREGHAQLHREPHRHLRRDPASWRRWRAASSRSRKSTRSPGPPPDARRAPRSGRWTSRASTCSRTSSATCAAASPTRRSSRPSRCRRSSRSSSSASGSARRSAPASTSA